VLASAVAVAAASGIGPGGRLLAAIPIHHGHGFSNNLALPLLSGATSVLLERFEPATVAAVVARHSVDYLVSSPVAYGLLLDAGVSASSLRSVRVCLSGGAPLAPAVAEKWRRSHGVPIRQLYGSTETNVISMQGDESEAVESVGRPIPGTEVRILEGDDPQPCGRMGEIAVHGPGVMAGYVAEPPETAASFWNGYLRTGDVGWLDEHGTLFLAGRRRPWINTGGVKVDPTEVRRVLGQMPGVRDCSVEAEPGPRDLEVVAAAIVSEPGVELTRTDVIRHCRQHLAEYKIPRIVRFLPALATDLTGKTPRPWSEAGVPRPRPS
jgi:long-chain acyl-CoA synthetase